MQTNCEVLLGDVNLPYKSNEMEDTDDNMFENTATVEMTKERNENRAMDIWPDCPIDVPMEENYD